MAQRESARADGSATISLLRRRRAATCDVIPTPNATQSPCHSVSCGCMTAPGARTPRAGRSAAESIIDPGAPFHAVCAGRSRGSVSLLPGGMSASRTGRDLLAPDAPGVAKNRRRRISAKGRPTPRRRRRSEPQPPVGGQRTLLDSQREGSGLLVTGVPHCLAQSTESS